MRSYQNALDAMNLDTGAISSWIDRHANTAVTRNREFPADAAIGVLNHFGHPLYTAGNLTVEQQDWVSHMVGAEQIIQQEAVWSTLQVSHNNATLFVRAFSSDLSWIRQWAQGLGIPLADTGNEYLINVLIDALRTCQGQSGAGSISHTTHSPPNAGGESNIP